jgi:DNA modification methylase
MIHHGDLFDVLPTLEADSIDACVTDPPYELGFMGKHWDASGVAYNVETWRQVMRVLKPGGYLLAFGGTRTYHRMACAIEDAGFEIRDSLQWLYGSGFPKSLDVSKAMDAAAGAERQIIRTSTSGMSPKAGGAYNFNGRDVANGVPLSESYSITVPATDLAKQWQGWGTALKPACEPICMARKPLRGTVAANVARYGTGAINVDACRIGDEQTTTKSMTHHYGGAGSAQKMREQGFRPYRVDNREYPETLNPPGRWPANVLLDEDAAAMLDEQTGELTSGDRQAGDYSRLGYQGWDRGPMPAVAGDSGGASRFYYVAKPSREERDYGLRDKRSTHPTVKPVELMRWLVKLVTPIDGIVLDPFTGSGTTGMACRYESRRFVGIEREAEYHQIAEARIAAVAPLFGEASA